MFADQLLLVPVATTRAHLNQQVEAGDFGQLLALLGAAASTQLELRRRRLASVHVEAQVVVGHGASDGQRSAGCGSSSSSSSSRCCRRRVVVATAPAPAPATVTATALGTAPSPSALAAAAAGCRGSVRAACGSCSVIALLLSTTGGLGDLLGLSTVPETLLPLVSNGQMLRSFSLSSRCGWRVHMPGCPGQVGALLSGVGVPQAPSHRPAWINQAPARLIIWRGTYFMSSSSNRSEGRVEQ